MSPQHRVNEEAADASSLTEPLLETSSIQSDHDAPTFSGLLFFRALFFLSGLSASTWGRFGVIFYNTVAHLSPFQIGILQGLMPLLSFFAMPCWGMAADCIQSRKQIYLITSFFGSIALLSLSVVKHEFVWILSCVSCMSIFRSSGVLDAFVLDYLGDRHRGMYGTVRLWTAISWGLGAVFMGYITDAFGFEWNFILYGVMSAMMLFVVAFALPARSKKEQMQYDRVNNDPDSPEHPKLAVLLKALLQLPVMIWLLEVIIIGSGMSVVESFLFVYLQNDLDASTKLCGMTVGVTVLIELPIFQFSKQVLEKVGHDALFAIAMVAYVIRAVGYTFLTKHTVHWVLALEALHGVTFACMWIASIDFSAAAAPKQWSTTFQTVLSACFACFGNVLGSVLGGWIMETYSAILMYRGIGCIVASVLVFHLVRWQVCGLGHGNFLAKQQTDEDRQSVASTFSDEEDEEAGSIELDEDV